MELYVLFLLYFYKFLTFCLTFSFFLHVSFFHHVGAPNTTKAKKTSSQHSKKHANKKSIAQKTHPSRCKKSSNLPHGPTLGYVVWDATNNQVLCSHGLDKRFYPASLTKMLTLYMLFHALEKSLLTLDTPLMASRLAASQRPSRLGIKRCACLSVFQCILALHLRSCNDVAMMIAENLGAIYNYFSDNPCYGDHQGYGATPSHFPLSLHLLENSKNLQKFMFLMNHQGKKLSLNQSSFQFPSGWHHPHQYTSLMDMARLTYDLWRDFPQYRSFISCGSAVIGSYGLKKTTNRLHGTIPGLIFGKTGYTVPSGYNLATLSYGHGRYLVVVVMGARTSNERFQKTRDLIKKYL